MIAGGMIRIQRPLGITFSPAGVMLGVLTVVSI
jgi:hypothetical protein